MKNNLATMACICIAGLITVLTMQYMNKIGDDTVDYLENVECVEETTICKSYNAETESVYSIQDQLNKEISELEYIQDKKEWFIAYKDIINKYSNYFDTPETIFDVYTSDEIALICMVVETECYGCDFDSKCNVASVILNRVSSKDSSFGDTVSEVITSDNQFAYDRSNITEDTILSVMYAYEIEDTTGGCVAFRSDKKPDTWYGWVYSFTDNCGHHFYKEKKENEK